MTRLKVACIQMRSGRDPARNRDDAVRLVEEAAAVGARYIQTPEMTSLVERDRARIFAHIDQQGEDGTLSALRDVARARRVVVHIGSLPVRDGEKIANRAFVIDEDGEIRAIYDKIHLFDVDLPNGETWRESATYSAGSKAVIAHTAIGAVGLAICYDIRFPQLYRAYGQAGAQIIGAPACFTNQTGEAHWVVLNRARAIETGSFMISAAQGGTHEDGRETFGHSIIVSPWGHVLAEGGTEPGVFGAEIDLAEVDAARTRLPTLRHDREFALREA
ncbi:MAG: carbon-nitrogen hydrolase family protein [Salinarimonadaceae bacterium]|nr:MAG: carbon-nitrogen hydrolase family protein [Salinarimonadaceae bacterium]TVR10684.1 MAG: carbon-nitrogen hydrolase family protein [Salinarimonadaceae bacterium]